MSLGEFLVRGNRHVRRSATDRGEHTVNYKNVLAFAARGRHGREAAEADIDFALGDHKVKRGRTERLRTFRLQACGVEHAVLVHDEIDEVLCAGDKAEGKGAGCGVVCRLGSVRARNQQRT
jgi:hypothetical protein